MSVLRQIARVVLMNLLSLRSRFAASMMIVVGMAAVVGVALSVFSMAAGLRAMMREGVDPARMIVLSQGAANENASSIPRDNVAIIADTPGVARGADGSALVSAQVNSNFVTRKRDTRGRAFATVYGWDPNIQDMVPKLTLLKGRMVTPGRHEIIAGKGAAGRLDGIELGGKVIFQDGAWEVVGIFDAPGGFNYVLVVDAETLRSALRRPAVSAVRVRLQDDSPGTREEFLTALQANPALKISAEPEETYVARQLGNAIQFYAFLAFGVGGIMGMGAIFAGLNTMYAAVAARRIEIATLRAIGFGAAPVAISVIVESLSLAGVGAIAGTLLAWLAFNGRSQDLGTFATSMQVTPGMVGAGLLFAAAIGLVGAIFPAIRAARLPVATALQVR